MDRATARWLLVLGIALPIALTWASTLWRPFFYPRFLIFVLPLYCALIGAGVARLAREWRVLGAFALAGLLVASAYSLRAHYTTPRTAYSSSDYRAVLADMASIARPGDVVLAAPPWLAGYVAGYLPNLGLRTVFDPRTADATETRMYMAVRGRVWVISYAPDGRWEVGPAEQSLSRAGSAAYADLHGDTRLRLFTAEAPSATAVGQPAATFSDGSGSRISLVDARFAPGGQLSRGQPLDLILRWQALGPLATDYTVFTHLLGPDSRVWGQVDSPPLAGYVTSAWHPGETVVDRYRLVVPPDAPTGTYTIEIGMYRPADGQRLRVGRSPDEVDRVIVGRFEVGAG